MTIDNNDNNDMFVFLLVLAVSLMCITKCYLACVLTVVLAELLHYFLISLAKNIRCLQFLVELGKLRIKALKFLQPLNY